ncbi:MAG: DUF6134 family protein [Caulobacteraceae bacterium]
MRPLALAALAALVLSGVASAATTGRTAFDVTRNGQPFGRHTINVSGSDASMRVESRVALRANFGPITAYRLEQTCTETWANGSLASLNCSTLKDGRRTEVRGQAVDGRLRVTAGAASHVFPREAAPTSWWTRPRAGSVTMIDTQTGAPMRVRVTDMGRETIRINRRNVQADRVRVRGTLTVDLWYDEQGHWVGCNFTARGQQIAYQLEAAPA